MGYLSLADFGLIGNQSGAALVSRLGSIEWSCFPEIDSPSHFGALLDDRQGGRFQLMPKGEFRSEQRYLQRTHVLETVFETPYGRATLTDWMPMDGSEDHEPTIYRKIDIIHGKIAWLLHCAPRFHYGRDLAAAEYHQDSILFRGSEPGDIAQLWGSVPMEITSDGNAATARFTLDAGTQAYFRWRWGLRGSPCRYPRSPEPSPRATAEFWRGWAHRCVPAGCSLAGPWHDAVTRSSLILKLLMHPTEGSIAESVTTSIPGLAGVGRTWDYRFSWIRDSATLIQVLANLGYQKECQDFFQWLCDIVVRDGAESLQPVYRLDGGKNLAEQELGFLQGYQGSRPVRIGNQTASIFQLDIFGHILLAAAEHYRIFGGFPSARLWPQLGRIADYVCQAWRRPDHGFWESRTKPKHFVVSKLFCWAALDRAIWLAGKFGESPHPRWVSEREILHRTILTQGFDPTQGSFIRAFGDRELDSSALLIPILGFLPIDDPRVTSTLQALQSDLSSGTLLRRYQGEDGVEGPDAHHLLSSLWLVSCLALAGRVDEAGDRLAELCTYATPLGILGEQVDPGRGETTGNFPSASAHLNLINSALYVGAARGRQILSGHLMGWGEPWTPAKTA